ncbi:MAG: tetratricopeptide repeat protein [Anaerolineales bacterium]
MRLTGERLRLSRGKVLRPGRVAFYSILIGGGLGVLWMWRSGQVQPLFLATPTATRSAVSHAEEGLAYFSAGDMTKSIGSYQLAVELDPGDPRLWFELARIQTYSSSLLTNDFQRTSRLAEARASADRAVETGPESSRSHAVRALAYDWSASIEDDQQVKDDLLTQAESSAIRGRQLDPADPLALAFYAEILADQQRYGQAFDVAEQAVARDPTLMDVHRVFGTVLESNGLYRDAIQEYLAATAISPNLTFLYLQIGANYRRLRDVAQALFYFDKAAQINSQLGIDDPIPYMAIGRTYLQEGEFIVAARNVERALRIDPSDPFTYGFLGVVYFKGRNYESAIPVLKCAVDGCTVEETGDLLCTLIYDCEAGSEQAREHGVAVPGTALGSGSVEFYYTYGSVLTAYAGGSKYPTACADAERVFSELMQVYGDDLIVAGIVAEGRAICLNPGSNAAPGPTLTATLELPSTPSP